MTPDEYKAAALRIENTPTFIDHARKKVGVVAATSDTMAGNAAIEHDRMLSRMIHAILGMITELGELCDPVKRHLIYGAALDRENLIEERGDQEWYAAGLFDAAIEAKLEDIWMRNIAKLRARFPDKFTEEQALNRDLGAENKALEATPRNPGDVRFTSTNYEAPRFNASAAAELVSNMRAEASGSASIAGDLLHDAANVIARSAGQPIQHGRTISGQAINTRDISKLEEQIMAVLKDFHQRADKEQGALDAMRSLRGMVIHRNGVVEINPKIYDLHDERDADHALICLRRLHHALGIDSPRQLRDGANRRGTELCLKEIAELKKELFDANKLKDQLAAEIKVKERHFNELRALRARIEEFSKANS